MKHIQTTIAILLSLLPVACDSGDGDVSQDAQQQVVDAGQNTDAISADAMNAMGCGPNNTICTGETICVADACEVAFGRTYELHLLLTLLETTDSKGEPWDLNGGAPDPYVVVEINGVEVMRTNTVDDSFAPEFPEATLQVIPAGATITATVFDSDIGSDDEVYVCEASPITPEELRQGGLTCGVGTLLDAPSLLLGIGLN